MRVRTSRASVISIHAPRTGSDMIFLLSAAGREYFNPRSPHGERLVRRQPLRRVLRISIHAPRTGSDGQYLRTSYRPEQRFQSTLPARGATDSIIDYQSAGFTISIHAPRTGSDGCWTVVNPLSVISIHAPRTGSDPPCRKSRLFCWRFQSTLPARGATVSLQPSGKPHLFQSTLPARGATHGTGLQSNRDWISIHAPRTGSDMRRTDAHVLTGISIHAPRTGSDRAKARRKQ